MRDRGRIDIHEISLERSKKLYIIEGINTNEKNDLRYRLKYQEIVMSLWNIPGGGLFQTARPEQLKEQFACVDSFWLRAY